MRLWLGLRRLILAGALLATVGCSGSSGHRDADLSLTGTIADGGGSQVDGGFPGIDASPGLPDVAAATGDVLGEPDRADTALVARDGGDATSGDAPQIPSDAPQAPAEAGSQREIGSDLPQDAPVGAKDAANEMLAGSSAVDRLAAAAAACEPQSRLTVPVDWQMVLAGELGCTFYAPASWQTIGAGTPMTFVVEDQSRVTGSSVMAGVDATGTATCTPHGIATWMFANNQDCVGFKELSWQEGVDVVAGIQIPRGEMVYSCTQSGIRTVGYLLVQIHGTWPLCNLLAFAFWMPETQIEARTCTLTQTLNSIQCPQGGTGCDDAACRQECIANGYAWGACDSDDACACSN
ncbi:MAG: hypothetical protein JXP73_19750 [Deltaproteobacteria bacterium]|nr:hypothetical protein [Deltaproteobacteria bacterium]